MRKYGKKKLAKLVLAAILSTGGVLCLAPGVAAADDEVTFDGNLANTNPAAAVINVDPLNPSSDYKIDIANFSTYQILTLNSAGNAAFNMFGGWTADQTADLSGYKVNVTGGTWGTITGAFAQGLQTGTDPESGMPVYASGNASGNTVNIYEGAVVNVVTGGDSKAGEASDNTVNIYGGTINGNVFGGHGATIAKRNTVNIYGGTINMGGVYAGQALDASFNPGISEDNTINLLGTITWTTGYLDGDGTQTLNVASIGNTINAIYGGLKNINFFLPKEMSNTDTMLTVTTSAQIDGAEIGVMAKEGTFTQLKVNDKVTLLSAGGGITDFTGNPGTVAKTTKKIDIPKSLTETKELEYTIDSDANNIYATITKMPSEESGGGESGGGNADAGGGNNSGSSAKDENNKKSLVETRAATVTMLNAGADMLASQGFAQAANAVAVEAAEQAKNGATGAPVSNSFTPFAAFGGSSMRAESGSHVDMKGFGINVGFAKEFANSQGKLLFGPVVEYGGGKYDSYNNDVHGDGGSHYWGFGLMARQTNHDGFYYEGSVRFGRVTSDYSADLNINNVMTHTSYDSASNYWAAHLGIGKVFSAGKQDTVDTYLKYFYSHQGGDDTNITLTTATGGQGNQEVSFDSVDSSRIRIGARYTHKINDMNSLYGGLAYQYEFGGEARAHYAGTPGEAPSPSVKGSSGMLELGWQVKPGGPLTLDLGVAGWAGKQRGGSVQLGVNWTF